MKLATYRDGSRDGQLVVVGRDLTQAHCASAVATRLQQVLDDWNFLSPQLQDLYLALNQGKARHAFAFEPQRCLAPLPRAYQWACDDGRGRLRHGSGDVFLGAVEPVRFGSDGWRIDADACVAAITGDLAAGATRERALESIRLLTIALRWRAEAAGDADGAAARLDPPAAFAPVAATPDELGAAYSDGRVRLRLRVTRAGRATEVADAAATAASFGDRIALLTRARPVRAGSIVATIAADANDPAAADVALRPGDSVGVEAIDAGGASVFGAIAQRIVGKSDDDGHG